MTKSTLEVVQSFQQSLGSGGSEWENLLAEDISFVGPVDQVKGRSANIELNKNFFPLVKNYVLKNVIEQSQLAVFEGVYTINTPSGGLLEMATAEIFEVKDGLIQNITIYYDAEAFRKEFSISGQ